MAASGVQSVTFDSDAPRAALRRHGRADLRTSGPGSSPRGREVVGVSSLRDRTLELAARFGGVPVRDVVLTPTLSGAWVAVAGQAVVKVHRAGTGRAALAARLRLSADPAWRDCLLAPTVPDVLALGADPGGDVVDPDRPDAAARVRLATVWPRLETIPPDPDAVPWADAGALLARLHSRAAPERPDVPVHGAVARVERALARLADLDGSTASPEQLDAVRVVRQAAAALPAQAREPGPTGRPVALVHGDWHLGQLGRLGRPSVPGGRGGVPRPGRLLLIDPDDLGVGDPAWDFARPGALLAAGLLPPHHWQCFVDAYRDAGGPALPAGPAEPWPAVDAVARAGVVQGAAAVVARAIRAGRPLEHADRRLVAACRALAAQP